MGDTLNPPRVYSSQVNRLVSTFCSYLKTPRDNGGMGSDELPHGGQLALLRELVMHQSVWYEQDFALRA